MNSDQQQQQKRRLDRRNAIKHIDYEPSGSSFESSSVYRLRTQSLDDDRSSFRIQGTDGEFDRICNFLGVSGPDDFAIPTAAWEARKSRSYHFPRSRFDTSSHNLEKIGATESIEDGLSDAFEAQIRVRGKHKRANERSRLNKVLINPAEVQASVRKIDEVRHDRNESRVSVGCSRVGGYGIKGLNPAEVQARVRNIDEVVHDYKESGVSGRCNNRVGGCGIKGTRSAVLSPPPAISLPVMENVISPWDICRPFGPQDDEDLHSSDGLGGMTSVMTKEEDGEIEKEDKGVDGKLETIFWSFGPRCDEELCLEDGFAGMNSVISREEGQEMGEQGGEIEQGKGVNTKVDMDRLLLRDNSIVAEIWLDTSNDGKDEKSVNAETVEPLNGISPNGEFKYRIKCWQKGDFLGRGSFGTVYEGFTDGGFFFAVKEVSLLDQGSQGKQSIFQLEQDNSKLYIFLELVTKGSLASLYQKYNLRDSQVSVYTRQILSGLNYLHCRNVVHRDIKCANILVDASGSVELADFGLAKATKLNDIKSLKGSAFWMAPEVVNQKKQGYGLAADIWSLGCTVLEMLTRKIPYSHLGGVQALFQIGCGQLPLIPTSLSIDAQDFILKCLQVNPDNRPTPAQLLDHPFVKQSSILAPPSPYRIGTKAKSFESPKSLNLDTHVNGDRSREGERDDCNESRVSVGCSRVGGYGIKGLNPAEIQARVRNIDEVVHDYNESGVSGRCNNRVGGCGIMGTRPAALAPPPAISLPVMDNVSSPWDVCRSSPGSSAIPGGGEIAGFIALSSSGFAATTNRANLLGQNPSGSTAYHSNKKRRRDAAVDKGTNLYVSEQDLRQHFGLTREEAARCLGVSVTTFKRHCRKHGILRWPCYRNRSSDIPGRPPDLHMVPPDFFDDLGACLETPISSFLEEIAASGSYEAEFLPPEQITVSFAYPTHNHPVCAQPRIASKEMASENTRSSDLTTQVEAHSEGHGSGSNYLTVPTFSNPALSQPVSSISETGPTVPQHISTIPGIGPSQLEARLEARGSGSSYLTVPTSSNPSSTQPMSTIPEPGPAIPQPVSTIPVTGPTIPHIMPPLIAQQDMRPVTIKAKYSDSIVRFKLPLTSGLAELNKNVAKRLNLRFDSFDVEYWDEEGLWILISCDEDLRDYLQLFSSLDNPVIKLSVLDKVVNANESSGSFKRKRPWDA